MSWSINAHIFPCKGCQDRYPACSDKCERYKAARAKYDERKSANDARYTFGAYTAETVIKNRDKSAKRRR